MDDKQTILLSPNHKTVDGSMVSLGGKLMINRRYWSATLYLILTVLGIILWLPIPEISHFIGASSLVYAFLFEVADHNFSFIALLWILFFVVNLVVWYVYGKKNNKYIYFFTVVGLELLVSLVFICIKVIIANYTDIIITVAGFVTRLISCCILAYIGRENIGTREQFSDLTDDSQTN